eukprot:COSAG06_NODE_651_length_13384_cov_2.712382_9_plen_145_part_00
MLRCCWVSVVGESAPHATRAMVQDRGDNPCTLRRRSPAQHHRRRSLLEGAAYARRTVRALEIRPKMKVGSRINFSVIPRGDAGVSISTEKCCNRSIRIQGKSHELEFESKWPFRLAIQLHTQIVKLGSENFTGKSFASAGKQLI